MSISPLYRNYDRPKKVRRRLTTIGAILIISAIVFTRHFFQISLSQNATSGKDRAPKARSNDTRLASTITPRKTYKDRHNMTTVREMMEHAWSNYERYAWGKDELRPITKNSNNWIGNDGLAATLIDALDTLYIMGFKDEFERAKQFVLENLDFDKDIYVPTFETNIRVLGGLIAAYDLSGDVALLEKARDLGDRLLRAFDTPSGMPYPMVNLKTGEGKTHPWAGNGILAEVGTMQMEFTRLSYLTGDQKYAKKALAVIDVMLKRDLPIKGLFPYFIDIYAGDFAGFSYSLGSLSDSFYEYLLKQWLLGNKTQTVFRDMYDSSVKAIRENLVRVSRDGYTYISSNISGTVGEDMEHLTCFSGGMFALGAATKKDRGWEEVLSFSENITETCYQMYHRSPLGISPERMNMEKWIPEESFYILRPEVIESIFYMWRLTHNQKYRDWGFEIMNNIQKHCRVENGFSGIENVTEKPPKLNNNMESFFLAETLKYLYLLFTDDSTISLDEYVFNTEAHPFRKNA